MADRYKAKRKTGKHLTQVNSGAQKEKPLIGKGKICIMLLLGTIIFAGIYIAAMKMHFGLIFHIYWILTSLLLCVFIYMKQRRDYLYFEMTKNGEISDESILIDRKRRLHIKYLLIVLIPLLLTVTGDIVYLVFLRDLNIMEAIRNLL